MALLAQSVVYLLNLPLDSENNHTYFFDNDVDQVEFFKAKAFKHYNDFSYIRKDKSIQVPEHIDNIIQCNYVMYYNPDYSNKIYFAFVKELIHKGDSCTELIIDTDPMQTYLFDYTIGQCFVEREHVADDTIGLHTIPEGLETGEYVCNEQKYDINLLEYVYLVNLTEDSDGTPFKATNIGGIPVAGKVEMYSKYESVANLAHSYDEAGKGEAIVAVYMVPKLICNLDVIEGVPQLANSDFPELYNYVIEKPSTINGYKPHNNKLFTYPYQYLLVSNNSGASNVLQFEHFKDLDGEGKITNKCRFEVQGIAVISGSMKTIPKDYKNVVRNHDEGIIGGKFPVLSWSSDLYTNWCTQNAVNIAVSSVASGASILAGGLMLMSGGGIPAGVGLIAGGVGGIANQLAKTHEQSLIPQSSKGNINGGDVTTAGKSNTFFYNSMSIKEEYARVIDKFFDVFGYKVNMIKVPNKDHRSNYWYTKTQEAYVYGNIPENELQKIRSNYNKGITFWRANKTFRNYSTNAIL